MLMRRNRTAALLVSAILLLGACTSSSDGETASAVSTSSTTTVPPLTKEAYRAAIVKVAKPVNAAMAKVASASVAAVPDRLDAVKAAASKAEEKLRSINPPPELAAGHDLLVEGYSLLASNAKFPPPGQPAPMIYKTTCDRTLAVNNVYEIPSTVWQRAVEELKDNGVDADVIVPKKPKERNRRRANGAVIRRGPLASGGRGELTVGNETGSDAVITLGINNYPALSVYIQRGKVFHITGIRDGYYRVYYASGEDWTGKSFTRDCFFARFEDPLTFVTTREGNYIQWSRWRLSLGKAIGRSSGTSAVDPSDYPG